MRAEDVVLVQDSFEKVVPIAPAAADLFYTRLFAIAPEVRPLFAADMSDQKDKLMRTLGVAVRGLDEPDRLRPLVEDLGRRHIAYGARPGHYEAVGAALLHALEQGLGEDWTPELAAAWERTYAFLAGVMQEAAEGF